MNEPYSFSCLKCILLWGRNCPWILTFTGKELKEIDAEVGGVFDVVSGSAKVVGGGSVLRRGQRAAYDFLGSFYHSPECRAARIPHSCCAVRSKRPPTILSLCRASWALTESAVFVVGSGARQPGEVFRNKNPQKCESLHSFAPTSFMQRRTRSVRCPLLKSGSNSLVFSVRLFSEHHSASLCILSLILRLILPPMVSPVTTETGTTSSYFSSRELLVCLYRRGQMCTFILF